MGAVGRGEVGPLLVVGDPLDPADTSTLDPSERPRVENVVFVGAFVAGAADEASVLLPMSAWSEQEGTLVNFEGRIQQALRCHLPRGEGRPGWKVAAELAAACDVVLPGWTSAGDVLRAMGESVPPYEGLDAEAIGLLGVQPRPAASVAT